jgi:FkbM family methyltransferase
MRFAESLLYRASGWDNLARVFVRSSHPLEFLGTRYGGWTIPTGVLGPNSTCYCVGVGEDISFDLDLIRRYDSNVYAFDPTPRAIGYIDRRAPLPPKFRFMPVGIWKSDEIMRFYEPDNPVHVSHSIVNLQNTKRYFEAPCRRLSSLMQELGHARLDLLKIDIEGAEYEVIQSLLDDNVDIGILCVEFDEANSPVDGRYRDRIRNTLRALRARRFRLAARTGAGNFTFLRT